jgi:hypothetical protein
MPKEYQYLYILVVTNSPNISQRPYYPVLTFLYPSLFHNVSTGTRSLSHKEFMLDVTKEHMLLQKPKGPH